MINTGQEQSENLLNDFAQIGMPFDNVNTDEFRKRYLIKCQNCSRLWKEVYADYKTKKIEGEYLKTISGFANRLGKNSNL